MAIRGLHGVGMEMEIKEWDRNGMEWDEFFSSFIRNGMEWNETKLIGTRKQNGMEWDPCL